MGSVQLNRKKKKGERGEEKAGRGKRKEKKRTPKNNQRV